MTTALKLRPYQEEGVRWLTDDYPHKLLADDMGLGKTPQCIAGINRLKAKFVVIVCPATVKIMWARRLVQWGVDVGRVMILKSGKDKVPDHINVVILNYSLMIKPRIFEQLVANGKKRQYDVVIFDEARALKSKTAKQTRLALGKKSFLYHAKRVWLLDGTPVPNRPIELWPILASLAPDVIDPYLSYQSFGERFCKGKRDIFGWDMSGSSNVDDLSGRLMNSGFYLRRTKEQVMDELPEKVETVIELEVQAPCDVSDTPVATVRRELAMAKVQEATNFIRTMTNEAGKVVVFAHHRNVIEALQNNLSDKGAVILYGGMSAEDKQKSIDNFINAEHVEVLIGQITAGGSGVDGLQGVCNHIVFVELDWSPGVMEQAIDRCRRIGQTKDTVFVYYLSVPGSLDDHIDNTLSRKRNVINKLIREVPITMSGFSQEFESALLNVVQSIYNLIAVGQGSEPVNESKPATRRGPKAKEKVEAAPDPEVKPVNQVVQPEAAGPTLDDALAAIDLFLSGTEGAARSALIEAYKAKILVPIAGVSKIKEADPKHYPAIMDALANGPMVYMVRADDDI